MASELAAEMYTDTDVAAVRSWLPTRLGQGSKFVETFPVALLLSHNPSRGSPTAEVASAAITPPLVPKEHDELLRKNCVEAGDNPYPATSHVEACPRVTRRLFGSPRMDAPDEGTAAMTALAAEAGVELFALAPN